ncbi:MAG: hypothetical protein J6B62_03115 [Bacteroidales bacterium]|nr:hypothetical protein [Bacteroidales bacterium]
MKRILIFLTMVLMPALMSAQEGTGMYTKGYRADVQFGTVLSTAHDISQPEYYLTTSQGYCFGNGLYLGGSAGLSLDTFQVNGRKNRIMIPVAAEIKYSFINRLASPFIGLAAGGMFDCTAKGAGFMVRPAVGVDIWRFSINVGVNYWKCSYTDGSFGNTGVYMGLSYNF